MRQIKLQKGEKEMNISIHAPLTGCDLSAYEQNINKGISIHAPLTGCDFFCASFVLDQANFNPRTPYGMRHKEVAENEMVVNFNPRTPYGMRLVLGTVISMITSDFNPRTPYGMRLY